MITITFPEWLVKFFILAMSVYIVYTIHTIILRTLERAKRWRQKKKK
jgi:hypothetical protein